MAGPVRFCSTICALLLTLSAARVTAHKQPPRITQLMTEVSDDVLVATTRGLLFGTPGAQQWSLLCSEAFGVQPGTPYRVLRLPSGRLVVGSLRGVRISDDHGCTWRAHAELGGLGVTYLAQDPNMATRLYSVNFDPGTGGIRVSDDGGETFRVIYRAPDSEYLNSLLVASGAPKILYATLSTTDEASRVFVLRSNDGGATWARSELTLAPELLDATLLAVNPVDPRELLLRVRRLSQGDGDLLVHSADGGQTFSKLGRYVGISGAAFSPDGAEGFVATGDGLLRASTPARAFASTVTSDQLTHVSVVDRAVMVGGYYVVGDALVVSIRKAQVADPAAALAPFMSFDQVVAPIACSQAAPANCDCALDWIDWSREFLPPTVPRVDVCEKPPATRPR